MMLTPGHRDELHRSGLSDETIARAGLYSATAAGVRDVLGFGAGPGLVFPYPSENGSAPYARVKLDKADADGKRYRSPARQPNRLYIPPVINPAVLSDPTTPLWLTEGEKKALKACQEGLACLALPGVWSWRTRDARDQSVPIPDLGLIAWRGRMVYIVFDSDLTAKTSVRRAEFALARELQRRGARVLAIQLPGGPQGEKVGLDDYLLGHSVETLCALEPVAILDPATDAGEPVHIRHGQPAPAPPPASLEPELRREGLDLSLIWPDGVRVALSAIRDGRDGVRGELTITRDGRRLSWGASALSSTAARETLRKKLDAGAPGLPWGERLEEAAWRLTQAARQGEPLVTLTGRVASPTRELMARFLYEGEPTLLYGDGDTGKSLSALTLAVTVQSGARLPFGLTPVRAVPAAYLDWETSRDTIEGRLAQVAAGLGIAPPPLLYKRMTRPLVDEVASLAAEFARRGVGFVVIDSMMFAVTSGDGAAFHEPITAFYNALRLFAPAATLVLSHVTGEDARRGGAARPFGGAFAFNGPRLIWEAKRDLDISDATAIAFTCRKANNLARRPEPFGLRFQPGDGTIIVAPFDLTEAAPRTVAGASLPYRLRLAVATEDLTAAELAERLDADERSVRRALERERGKGLLMTVPDTKPQRWGISR